ncbi:MAG: head-tail connector protein [Hyphomicrobiaceae bacterium]|nr:head-tail connector protein [Hyphomicrobiaceae bacterium]
MGLVLTSGPLLEPVSLAEAKAHLRIDTDDEDIFLASLVTTSRLHVEVVLSAALITQTWTLVRDAWPQGRILALPLRPLRGVTSISVRDGAGLLHPAPLSEFIVDTTAVVPRIVRKLGTSWPAPGLPANGIEIVFTAGYGDTAADVPAPIRQALLLLVAHWYEHRDPSEVGSETARVPSMITELLAPYTTRQL